MFRKILPILIFFVVAVCAQAVLSRSTEGRWTVFPTVAENFSNIIETPKRVYALTGGTLMHQNFDDNEFYVYTDSRLSDRTRIRRISYNYGGGYLLIVYESNNMDMLFDDNTVVNLPEIRDAALASTRDINSISFHGGRIYLATDFGLVVYDDSRREVVESGIYNIRLQNANVVDGHLVVRTVDTFDGKNIFEAPLDVRHNSWDVFRPMGKIDFNYNCNEFVVLSDNSVILNDSYLGRAVFDFENHSISVSHYSQFPYRQGALINPTADGAVIHFDNGSAYFFTGAEPVSVRVPQINKNIFTPDVSGKSVWFTADGKAVRYDLTAAEPTVLMTLATPQGLTTPEPVQMQFTKDGDLYISNVSAAVIYTNKGDNWETPFYLDYIETNGTITDLAVHNADEAATRFPTVESFDRRTGRMISAMTVVQDPDDPDLFFVADNRYGLVAVKNNEIVEVFDSRNSVAPPGWPTRNVGCAIDTHGNLWRMNGYIYAYPNQNATLSVLPAEKRRGNLSEIKREDWIALPELFMESPIILARGARMIFSKKYPGYSILSSNDSASNIKIRYDNGTPLNFGDDRYVFFNCEMTDRESNIIDMTNTSSLAEDHEGRIWIGFGAGVVVIDDIRKAFDADFRVRRPIVARNDGTAYGDYLMDGEMVYGVAIDPSDRKWIATRTSGVYLVSPDGSEIIAHYDTENSPLPTNRVQAVAADPNSNRVFFGTPQGVVMFESDSSPAADDYSDVYVYPNPVRPEYTGWITVRGLMDNSLVKIADAAGNVFFQGRSEGGMISWDGCGADGQRVRSGIYFVFASQNENGSSPGVVAKFMVVN